MTIKIPPQLEVSPLLLEHAGVPPTPTAATRPGSLERLPTELKQQVATHLKGRDRLHFSMTSKAHHAALRHEVASARLASLARHVRDLAGFRALLGPVPASRDAAKEECIMDLRADLRPEPLVALVPRIAALPLEQQCAARRAWHAAADPLASSSAIIGDEQALQTQAAQLAGRVAGSDTITGFCDLLGPRSGAGNSPPETICDLRADFRPMPLATLATGIAALPAQEQHDATVFFRDAVAELPPPYRTGLEKLSREAEREPHDSRELQCLAIACAIRMGVPAADIIRRTGITGEDVLASLRAYDWGNAVRHGDDPHQAALRCGFTNGQLLAAARYLAAKADIVFDESLPVVVERYGIHDAGTIRTLASQARREAADAIQNRGVSLPAAIARHGIADAADIARLTELALAEAKAAIDNGETVEAVIARFGFVDADHIAQLAWHREDSEHAAGNAAFALGGCMLAVQ